MRHEFAVGKVCFFAEHDAELGATEMSCTEVPALERYLIGGLPEGLYYIPNFLSPEEERSLLEKVSRCLSCAEPKDTKQTMD